MRMTKEVFIANGKFYLKNPFKKNNKQNETVGKASLLCNGWRFSQVNNFTLVEEIDSDIYYKFPSKDGVICICGKQVTNKVVYYRKKSLYLFLKENKITTIQRCNPNTIYYSTSNDFRIVTDGVVKENIINFSKVMGIHNKQDFEISHCVSKASFVILSTKHKTILYTEESVDKVQALLKKYKEKLKITNTVVELHKK